MVCLDVTNALSNEEKQLLFDAYLFFKQSFSAKELSYYYPLKELKKYRKSSTAYNEKRIIRIYDQKEEETFYEFQQGVVDYLDQWFQQKEEILGLEKEKAVSNLKEKERKLDDEKN